MIDHGDHHLRSMDPIEIIFWVSMSINIIFTVACVCLLCYACGLCEEDVDEDTYKWNTEQNTKGISVQRAPTVSVQPEHQWGCFS